MSNQKSQIAQALTMELVTKLLIAAQISENRELVTYGFVNDLYRTLGQLADSHPADHEERLAEANLRAQRIVPLMVEVLDGRVAKYGDWQRVEWVGQDRAVDTSVADVRVHHENGRTDFSLKSTSGGDGTLRNLGMGGLIALSATIADIFKDMQTAALRAMTSDPQRAKELVGKNGTIRHSTATAAEKEAAKAAATGYLTKARDEVVTAFNSLPLEERRALIDTWQARDMEGDVLFVALVTDDKAEVKKVLPRCTSNQLHAVATGASSILFSDETENLIRGAINCTNGIGVSSLTMRTFNV